MSFRMIKMSEWEDMLPKKREYYMLHKTETNTSIQEEIEKKVADKNPE